MSGKSQIIGSGIALAALEKMLKVRIFVSGLKMEDAIQDVLSQIICVALMG